MTLLVSRGHVVNQGNPDLSARSYHSEQVFDQAKLLPEAISGFVVQLQPGSALNSVA